MTRRWGIAAGLALSALVLYARTRAFPFINLDDPGYVESNAWVQQGLSWHGLRWSFSTFEMANWHPFTWLSLMAGVSLFGPGSGAMHGVNAALHAANAVLVYLVLSRMTGATWRSALVAGLFALHPMHVESVAWISERKDVLSVFFGLLTLLAYEHHSRRPGIGRFLAVATAFAASLLAKPMLVTLPCLLLLLDVWPLGRMPLVAPAAIPLPRPVIGWRRAILEKLPLLALGALDAVMTYRAQAAGGAVAPDSLSHRIANAVTGYARYLGKLLWPADLSFLYPVNHAGEPALRVVASLAVVVGVSALTVVGIRKRPWATVGWFWFLGTLVPVIGLVQVGWQSMADRYVYFPALGLWVAIVWTLAGMRWQPPRLVTVGLAVSVLGALAWLTHDRIELFGDEERLYRQGLSVTGPNDRLHEWLGSYLYSRGRREEAREQFLEAARIYPTPSNLKSLGNVSDELGMLDQAERAFRTASSLDPGDDDAVVKLAEVVRRLGRASEASALLLDAARRPVDPRRSASQRAVLGAALVESGNVEEGIAILEDVVQRVPGNPELLSTLSEAYLYIGDRERAEGLALRAVNGRARGGGAYQVLGALRSARGDWAGAVEVLERGKLAEVDDPFRRLPLAEALAATGRLTEACENWSFVLRSPRALPPDRQRASEGARLADCLATPRPPPP